MKISKIDIDDAKHLIDIYERKGKHGDELIAELRERVGKLTEMGRTTADKISKGDLGDVEGSHVSRGCHVPTYRNVRALGWQRRSWKISRVALAIATGEIAVSHEAA